MKKLKKQRALLLWKMIKPWKQAWSIHENVKLPAIFTLNSDLDAVNEEGGSSSSWFPALICMMEFPVEADLKARAGGCSEVDRESPEGWGWVNGSETEWDGQGTGTDAEVDLDPVSVWALQTRQQSDYIKECKGCCNITIWQCYKYSRFDDWYLEMF